jgi:uncharacterized protein YheU (UPF0270 family)
MTVQITHEKYINDLKADIARVELEISQMVHRSLRRQKQKELVLLYNELKGCMKIKDEQHQNMLIDSEKYFDDYDNDEESCDSPDCLVEPERGSGLDQWY